MDGILLLDKPAGPSSHDVVARVRRELGQREAGHAGTLDPQASGLLIMALGSATRWLNYLPMGKRYRASLKLGLATDTEDIWGKPTQVDELPAPEPEALRAALEGLKDLRQQVPPMVSALKKDGRRLYELARQGLTVERPPRPLSISAVRVLGLRGLEADFEVDCSGGTYVRSLCVEVGRRLGRPACMSALRRLGSGDFSVEQALPESGWTAERFSGALLGPERALKHLPERTLSQDEVRDVLHGRALAGAGSAQPGSTWRLSAGSRLLALAEVLKDGRLQPRKVFGERAGQGQGPAAGQRA